MNLKAINRKGHLVLDICKARFHFSCLCCTSCMWQFPFVVCFPSSAVVEIELISIQTTVLPLLYGLSSIVEKVFPHSYPSCMTNFLG